MAVHIFYGYAKRRCPERPRCMYCDKRRTWVAFTYFGAPVCGPCWDEIWRKTEDGECDPPFDAITNPQSGEWLTPARASDRGLVGAQPEDSEVGALRQRAPETREETEA